jgi:hypothetical protein
MQYQSVTNLKHEIRRHLELGSFLAKTVDIKDLQVSLGVRRVGTNDYHLAVRVRDGLPAATEALKVATTLRTKGEIDFRVTRRAHIIDGCGAGSAAKVTTFNIGASIGHKGHFGGTLGFFAKRRGDDAPGFVSANHVIALNGEPATAPDRDVVFPSQCDSATPAKIATLDLGFPKLDKKKFATADCAFAELLPGTLPANPRALLETAGLLQTTPVPAFNTMKVFKIGRTTGKTNGQVRAFDFDTLIVESYPFGSVHFKNQIEIESIDAKTFSDPGDSGSLVFDEGNHPVGLLFAETDQDTHGSTGLQYATPIKTVLDALGVDILE